MSEKVSIIIPSRNEIFLTNTIKDLLKNAHEDIEIIPILDGYWPKPEEIVNDPRVKYLHRGEARGMRDGINSAAAISTGQYLMKLDAHCMVDEGFDVKLKADMEKDWVVVPRRKRLDATNWCIKDVGKPDVDYEFLSYPHWKPEEPGIHGTIWTERIKERSDPKYDLDEDMAFQGSCWFMHKDFFNNVLEGMQEEGYGTFIGEPQEIGMKAWLSGGKLMRNKKTWYAHLHKGKEFGRGYFFNKKEAIDGNAYSVDYWMNNRWPKAIHTMEWLVERFWPVPTWPEDRSKWKL
jgi:glycosyltransferase involved in cell wall biosynthesis